SRSRPPRALCWSSAERFANASHRNSRGPSSMRSGCRLNNAASNAVLPGVYSRVVDQPINRANARMRSSPATALRAALVATALDELRRREQRRTLSQPRPTRVAVRTLNQGSAMENAREIQGGLSDEEKRENVIHFAFDGDRSKYEEFCRAVEEVVPRGTRVILRGSSVTGTRWNDGAPFDADGPRTSDLDLTLV